MLLVYGTAVDWAHPGNDDPDCDPVLVVHYHAAHRIASQPSQTSPEGHCFLCHTLRLLHSARTQRAVRLTTPQRIAVVATVTITSLLGGHATATSSRGPPPVHF
jgi:hypothetical protein